MAVISCPHCFGDFLVADERAALAARLREMVATRPDEPRCPVCEMTHHARTCIVPELLRLADELDG